MIYKYTNTRSYVSSTLTWSGHNISNVHLNIKQAKKTCIDTNFVLFAFIATLYTMYLNGKGTAVILSK